MTHRMIAGLERIHVRTPDLAGGERSMTALLGRAPSLTTDDSVVFTLANTSLALARSAPGESEGLAALAFRTLDLDGALRASERRGLGPRKTGDDELHFAPEALHGIEAFLVENKSPKHGLPPSDATSETHVTGLDHVVIRTPNPDRAAALYAARLGLDMRLDRTAPEWGTRLMFFRCGDLIVEVMHELTAGISDAPDRLWGLSWRVPNADAAQARLKTTGFNVSEVRKGRKPGTRVFTVRAGTLGVPTLMIEPARAA